MHRPFDLKSSRNEQQDGPSKDIHRFLLELKIVLKELETIEQVKPIQYNLENVLLK